MLLESRQAKGEDVALFARRTQNLSRKVQWSLKKTKIQILEGLLPEYSILYVPMRSKEHANITELVRDIEEMMEGSRRRNQTLQQFDRREDLRSPRGTGCFNCGKDGHRAFECRALKSADRGPKAGGAGAPAQENGQKNFTVPAGGSEKSQTPQANDKRSVGDAAKPNEAKATREPWTCHRCGQPGPIAKNCAAVRAIEESVSENEFRSLLDEGSNVKQMSINGKPWLVKVDSGLVRL